MTTNPAIVLKLKKLLAMTTENGATEAEALQAAEAASRLMVEHKLSLRSIEEIEAQEYREDSRPFFRPRTASRRAGSKPPIYRCLGPLSDLCACEYFWSAGTGNLTFYGTKMGTEMAHHLVKVFGEAIETEWLKYRDPLDRVTAQRCRSSFHKGIAYKLGARLARMKEEQSVATGRNALVVVADAHLKDSFQKRHKVSVVDDDKQPSHPAALLSGWLAGDKIPVDEKITEAKSQ